MGKATEVPLPTPFSGTEKAEPLAAEQFRVKIFRETPDPKYEVSLTPSEGSLENPLISTKSLGTKVDTSQLQINPFSCCLHFHFSPHTS